MNNVIQGTVRKLERKYKGMPDEYVLQEIETGHHAGEALFYLLFGRYADMLEIIYSRQPPALMGFDDFMLELDIRLFKDGCQAVLGFRPEKATFKTYLGTIARNLLYDLREKDLPTIDIFTLWETLRDNDEREEVVRLVEAINSYPDKDSRYVLLKTIEGYKSKEIAAMLAGRRHEEGTLDGKEELKPSYIDTLRSRALKAIRERIFREDASESIDECCYRASRRIKSCVCSDEMADMLSAAPKSLVGMQLSDPGLFIGNIINLYDRMMKE